MSAAASPLEVLASALKPASYYKIMTEFEIPGDKILFILLSSYANSISEYRGPKRTSKPKPKATDVAGIMREVAGRYPKAKLQVEALQVEVNGPTKKGKLTPIIVQAWQEALGQTIPTDEEAAQMRKAVKDAKKSRVIEIVALLRSGPNGVQEFNNRPSANRVYLDLRNVDLTNLDLSGLRIGWLRLDGADLSGSKLVGATIDDTCGSISPQLSKTKLVECDLTGVSMVFCKCTDADFSRAKLRNTILSYGSKARTNFAGADLTNADLTGSDLKGANFTGATLAGCKFGSASFDEQTKWPKGFTPPPDMKWKGKGPDPRFAPTKREKKKPPPSDFGDFLTRLQKATDPAKLQKATAMLKADRFRLFAKVTDDHVVGVVKSQSDPTLVYACRLAKDGTYACCTQNLNVCGGLRGSPCKHLLVLIVGLTKAGEIDPGIAHAWTQSSRGQKPVLDKDGMTETFLQYKGAEAGEVDWRPTETIPEDYYAM